MEHEFKINNGTLEKYTGTGMDIVIPENVTVIGKKAFSGNTYIKTVTTNSELINIDDYAFENCGSLRAVELGPNVKRIGYAAFEGCSNLTKINIPDSLEEIGTGAFDILCSISDKKVMEKIWDIEEATEDRMLDKALPMLKNISKEFRGTGIEYEAYPAGDKMIIDLPESEFSSSLELPFITDANDPRMAEVIQMVQEFVKKEKSMML